MILIDDNRVTTDTAKTLAHYCGGSYVQHGYVIDKSRKHIYRDGAVTSNFRKKRRLGQIGPLPYRTFTLEEKSVNGSFQEYYSPAYIDWLWLYFDRKVCPLVASTDGLIDISLWNCPTSAGPFSYYREYNTLHEVCNAKLLEKVKDMKIDLSVAFGTRQQTVDFIASTATKFAGTLRCLKKGDLGGARRTLFGGAATSREAKRFKAESDKHWYQAMSNQWLEMQYAWSPTLSDIYAGIDLCKTFPVRPTKVIGQKEIIDSYSKVTKGGGIDRLVTAKHKLRLRETMFCSLDDDAISSMTTSAAQIGLMNPALLAWDILPFSFVVDWFLPVGSYLSSFDAMVGIKFHHIVVSTKYEEEIKNEFYGTGKAISYSNQNIIRGFATYTKNLKEFTRSISYDKPVPTFPSFKNPVSASHAMTSLSLMIALFSSNKR